jgi:hypothetical protein
MGSHWPSYTVLMQPFGSWVCRHVKTSRLVNVMSIILATNTSLVVPWTLKQITQYNKYCIWILKPRIQIKFSTALLETYQPWIILKSWYCVRRKISLCCIVLFNAIFQSFSIQAPLECFYVFDSIHSNHKCKVFIAFQLGLHIEKDGAHTPCNHAKKVKNVARG